MTDHSFVNAASDSCHIKEIKGSLTEENSGEGSVKWAPLCHCLNMVIIKPAALYQEIPYLVSITFAKPFNRELTSILSQMQHASVTTLHQTSHISFSTPSPPPNNPCTSPKMSASPIRPGQRQSLHLPAHQTSVPTT
jgi:hypothetical protein